jgi:hypothetical protein
MFVKIMPDKVGNYWNLVKPGLMASNNNLAGSSNTICNNILLNAMAGRCTIWLAFDGNTPDDYTGFVITSINNDPVNNEKFLLIYLAYAYTELSRDLALEIYATILKFARGESCTSVKAYGEVGMEVLLKRYWGNIFQTSMFFNFPL